VIPEAASKVLAIYSISIVSATANNDSTIAISFSPS